MMAMSPDGVLVIGLVLGILIGFVVSLALNIAIASHKKK